MAALQDSLYMPIVQNAQDVHPRQISKPAGIQEFIHSFPQHLLCGRHSAGEVVDTTDTCGEESNWFEWNLSNKIN